MSQTVDPQALPGEAWNAYDLPVPSRDGYKANAIQVIVGGTVNLDLIDENALTWINSLRLGQEARLTVTVRVAAIGTFRHSLKGEFDEDYVVYPVGLKVTNIDVPEA